jgi:peptide/nickel transport system substrate-binding protein
MKQQVSLRRGVLLALPVLLASLAFGRPPVGIEAETADPKAVSDDEVAGPGAAKVDEFHPEGAVPAAPLYGGRVIVHLASMPENINYAVENSAVTRRMLYEVHESLLVQDWEFHDYRERLAEQYWVEDLVILKPEHAAAYGNAVEDVQVRNYDAGEDDPVLRAAKAIYGTVEESELGFKVTPFSPGSALEQGVEVAADHVELVEAGAVMTFRVKEGVRWHPSVPLAKELEDDAVALGKIEGQTLDARDMLFSWSIYFNPKVDCDEKRFLFEKIPHAEIVDDRTVRFFYQEQYFKALDTVGTSLTMLPSHIYDLSDPDNPDFDSNASESKRAEHINDNVHNKWWVGLGPYRVTTYDQSYIEASRFTDDAGKPLYFDLENSGYIDTIRWRLIDDDAAAMVALLAGELDYFERVKSADYFGPATEDEQFTSQFYKGYKYLGTYGYTGWNMYKPQLADLEVRKAIAHAFDFAEYRRTNYKDLCNQVTGPMPFNSAAYNHEVEPLAYDVDAALDLLDEAGWYDSNGDGVVDKDGVELVIKFMMPSGNDASTNFGLKLQESLAGIGIKIEIVAKEWATFLEDFKSRKFDSANLAWVPPLESDPEQLWHSKHGGFDVRGSNNSGVMDPYIDELILKGQRELDHDKRMAIWKEMHRYIYNEIQPYMFMYNVPTKFAMSKRLRGFQALAIDPGYVIRRWYYIDPAEKGTRTSLVE